MGNSKRRTRNNKIKKELVITKKGSEIVIKLTVIFFAIVIFSTIFALLNSINTKILPRIKVNGIAIDNLEIKDAYQKVQQETNNRIQNNMVLKYEEYETTISLQQLEVTADVIEAVNRAYTIGRNKNIIRSNYQIIGTLLVGNKIETPLKVNQEELDKLIEDISAKIPGVMKQSSYYMEGESLIIYPGEAGIQIKKEELKTIINEVIKQQIMGEKIATILIPVEPKNPESIDIEKIHEEIYQEPKNAYCETDPFKLHTQVNGIDFKISIEEAKQLLAETKEEYSIPLIITLPKITTESLGEQAFPEQLGKYTTRYDESNKNRSTNIKLASEKIDKKILMPGEIFSYNKVVGERTIKTGYKEAAVYMNGKVVDGIGGGICQVSSTLYNAALDANLEIVKRTNHYFITSYVPASRDATVSYGTIDFQFKNNRTYPIKIECRAKNGISEITILGIKEAAEYEVVVQDEITEVIPYTVKYVDTDILQKGEENIIQQGSNGYKSQAYKVVKLNGKIISKTLLSKDSYNPMQRVIERGTK